MAREGGNATRVPRMRDLTKEEKKSVTHGDFWVPEAEREVYKRGLRALNEQGIPYVVAGAYAIYEHTGIYRDTKDLDVFVEPEHTVAAARVLRDAGFTTRLEQPHWLAKAFDGDPFIDLIFGMGNGLALIDAGWYQHSRPAILAATPVRVAPAEELLWHRLFIHERHRQDMGDIIHLIACVGHAMSWERLLERVAEHWPLLLAQLQIFMYVYPEVEGAIPRWVHEELLGRAAAEVARPRTGDRVTRGTLISRFSFNIDVTEWKFRDEREESVRRRETHPVVRAIAASDVWMERSQIVDEYDARIEHR
jgi:Nucleotidyl transferase of unknown function (DUF2204)